MKILRNILFWILSFTWGLPLTLVGILTILPLILIGKKPHIHGPCIYFIIGESWGGLELGPFILVSELNDTQLRNHEFGHGLQNIVFGPLMIPIITIPSAIRYHYRNYIREKLRTKYVTGTLTNSEYRYIISQLPTYDSIWFEGQATRWGTKVYDKYYSKGNIING